MGTCTASEQLNTFIIVILDPWPTYRCLPFPLEIDADLLHDFT